MTGKLKELVCKLSLTEELPNVFNLYSPRFSDNLIRQNNLLLYFKQMAILKPTVLFVGEAPGHQGCRLTGVPFTSEYILLKGVDKFGLFGKEQGYGKTTEFGGHKKEPTATIIWETLSQYNEAPLLWNAFPFHPHKRDNYWSNREPNSEEVKIGAAFLNELLEIYRIKKIVAVGNKAEKALEKLNRDFVKIRHPSCGGKPEFVEGVRKIFADGF